MKYDVQMWRRDARDEFRLRSRTRMQARLLEHYSVPARIWASYLVACGLLLVHLADPLLGTAQEENAQGRNFTIQEKYQMRRMQLRAKEMNGKI